MSTFSGMQALQSLMGQMRGFGQPYSGPANSRGQGPGPTLGGIPASQMTPQQIAAMQQNPYAAQMSSQMAGMGGPAYTGNPNVRGQAPAPTPGGIRMDQMTPEQQAAIPTSPFASRMYSQMQGMGGPAAGGNPNVRGTGPTMQRQSGIGMGGYGQQQNPLMQLMQMMGGGMGMGGGYGGRQQYGGYGGGGYGGYQQQRQMPQNGGFYGGMNQGGYGGQMGGLGNLLGMLFGGMR